MSAIGWTTTRTMPRDVTRSAAEAGHVGDRLDDGADHAA
jgi:hypothetical protein